jgi:hypothetical protein
VFGKGKACCSTCGSTDTHDARESIPAQPDDLERLAAWKREALQELAVWDECYDLLPADRQRLGQSKSNAVRDYLRDLRTERNSR